MRIDQLSLTNFKCFGEQTFDLHPRFTLFVGDNGSGKTSILDGLAVAASAWLRGVGASGSRPIRRQDVRVAAGFRGDGAPAAEPVTWSWEPHFPCAVQAKGEVLGHPMIWSRTLAGWHTRTSSPKEAADLEQLAMRIATQARQDDTLLPLVASYGVCRLCHAKPGKTRITQPDALTDKAGMSRFAGYEPGIDGQLTAAEFVRWIARQSWIRFEQGGRQTALLTAVQEAVVSCVPGARALAFDPGIGEVVLRFGDETIRSFNHLSDGQRAMLAMVGDIARRAATLNPHLGADAPALTPGIVLIDELDLHLHPKWQRRVAADLKRVFQRMQFVCTTHSPQILGELSREEVRLLRDGRPGLPSVARGADSNWILDHVMDGAASENTDARALRQAAEDALDDAKLAVAREHLEKLRMLIDGDTAELVELESYLDRLERLSRIDDAEDQQ